MRLAISTTETLTYLKTDLVVANNNNNLTVWASGVNIPDVEVSLDNYIEEITAYLKGKSLLISTPTSSVTLLTSDTHQAKTHPSMLIEDSRLPLVK